MYTNILNYINKQKPVEYETALDKYLSTKDLYNFIDGYIADLMEIQNDEDIFIVPILSEFDPNQELMRIDDIFNTMEEKGRIYPRMYIYLHRNFNAIRDGAILVNKIDDAIDIFEELKDRVGEMMFIDDDYEEKEDSLKTVLDATNPVIGQSGYTFNDEINEFVEIYAFMIDKIVEHDNIIKENRRINEDYDRLSTSLVHDRVDLSRTASFDGFLCLPPALTTAHMGYMISEVDILLNLLHLMESYNVTAFWSKEINDAVEENDDYTSDWGYFSIHVPSTFKVQIPERLKDSMYKYIKFLSDQQEKFMTKYNPQLTHNKSKKYFGISMSDEFLYEFNNEVRDLLFDVYIYNALINENNERLSKERFNKLLDMIDRTHGIISHNHIIIKFMLYYKILTSEKVYSPSGNIAQLLTIFELLYDYEHFIGTTEDIESIVKYMERRYKPISMRHITSPVCDKYEPRLLCMVFNCTMLDDILDNLKSKI